MSLLPLYLLSLLSADTDSQFSPSFILLLIEIFVTVSNLPLVFEAISGISLMTLLVVC